MAQTIATTPTASYPSQGAWTYDDYLALPDDGRRYEIIEGLLYVTDPPDLEHQLAVGAVAFAIRSFIREAKFGYVLMAPLEVHLSNTTRPVQPDVIFCRPERWPGADAQFFSGAPDVVVEVTSRSTSRVDHAIKLTAYEKAGVPEYWVANPKARSVQVYVLAEGE